MLSLSLASPSKLPSLPLKPSNSSRQSFLPSSSPPKPNSDQLNHRLIGLLNAGHLRKAISTLDVVAQKGTHPDLTSYSLLLKSCIRSRNFGLGKLVHARLTQSQIDPDSVVLNSLISLYSKCGDWEEAKAIFDGMGDKRNLVSWSAMVSCFANNDMEVEAIGTFLEMLDSGFNPNEYCLAAVIRACSNADNISIGKIIFSFVIKSGYFESDLCVGCALIDMFVKGSGDVDLAYKVFEKMPEKNAVSWTLMITRFMQLGYSREAIDLFLDMILSGYVPDRFTVSAVLSACAELKLLSLGQQLHSWAIHMGLALDACIGCCLVDVYSKCAAIGAVDDARKVFNRMIYPNVMSWTAIITGYVQSGGLDMEALKLFCEMIEAHVMPNHFTFSSVLKASANLSDPRMGEQVYAHAVKLGLASVNCVGNSLISMYARSGMMEDARKAFDMLFDRNLVSYNAIVDGYAKNLNSNEAFELFHEIEDAGIGASAFTYASLLSGAASIGAIGKGEQIHASVLKSGFESNQCISNALISMYSRCGNIEAALQVFDDMGDRNVISWTSMITGFAKHGFASRAIEMFHKMLEIGVRPNEITYISVLSACSHVGLVSEGWKHFNAMYKEHGIVPKMEHYACMVDLLGRSGSLLEAFEFINAMPFNADTLVWRTFLAACRVHGNKELGKHAAKMIIEQDPHDPSAYILLSNLYASSGQLEDAAIIRKSMKERNLNKEAGCSWIEVENSMHKFHVGDTSHPLAREIYDELNHLALKIKGLGYVPDTDFVLHDVEDELKEQYLFQHSEKIAVAFGLISTTKSKPIRVFKNLRICGECHAAIKHISVATGREIVGETQTGFTIIKMGTVHAMITGDILKLEK